MSQGLLIMKPQPVLDTTFVSSTVPEADYPAWAAGTTYAVGAMVMLASSHSVYESSLASNVGNSPHLHPDKWTRVRATNRWRCFDGTNNSQTEQAGSISYVFAPGLSVAMVAALGLVNCNSLRVRLVAPGYGTVYDKTLYPGPLPIQPDPWEWAFGEWAGGKTLALFDDLPAFPTAQLLVDLVGGPQLALSQLMFGQPRRWGFGIENGARVERKVYSRRDVNKYGDIELIKRPSAKRGRFEMYIIRAEVDPLMDYLDAIDASVCLFVGAEVFESTVIVGICEDAQVLLERREFSVLQLEVLGVI